MCQPLVPEEPEILVVVHGTPPKKDTAEANAEYYAASWIDFAEEHGLVLIVPAFNQEDFSSRRGNHALSGYRGSVRAGDRRRRMGTTPGKRPTAGIRSGQRAILSVRAFGRGAIHRTISGDPPRVCETRR